ncbi:hypothetical protein BCR34DRAFT_587123 [Clohesyomyces aquaticus]|uniref:Uncharacterized protein n=1 Tax=Clohesyomyces aquaticus TaxID=1231657 RepID=A0A1Y1ZQF4_9PLEO|nr:hypothetical protein BCR34DRAFT_587123 [Clohesyomyces aquaticus]
MLYTDLEYIQSRVNQPKWSETPTNAKPVDVPNLMPPRPPSPSILPKTGSGGREGYMEHASPNSPPSSCLHYDGRSNQIWISNARLQVLYKRPARNFNRLFHRLYESDNTIPSMPTTVRQISTGKLRSIGLDPDRLPKTLRVRNRPAPKHRTLIIIYNRWSDSNKIQLSRAYPKVKERSQGLFSLFRREFANDLDQEEPLALTSAKWDDAYQQDDYGFILNHTSIAITLFDIAAHLKSFLSSREVYSAQRLNTGKGVQWVNFDENDIAEHNVRDKDANDVEQTDTHNLLLKMTLINSTKLENRRPDIKAKKGYRVYPSYHCKASHFFYNKEDTKDDVKNKKATEENDKEGKDEDEMDNNNDGGEDDGGDGELPLSRPIGTFNPILLGRRNHKMAVYFRESQRELTAIKPQQLLGHSQQPLSHLDARGPSLFHSRDPLHATGRGNPKKPPLHDNPSTHPHPSRALTHLSL